LPKMRPARSKSSRPTRKTSRSPRLRLFYVCTGLLCGATTRHVVLRPAVLLSLLAALTLLPTVAKAHTISDGDTLKQGGVTCRLFGQSIVCQEKDRDRYGGVVAICQISGQDMGAILVREGLA
jgi:hypothetical protein